jgi:hypothetical protein
MKKALFIIAAILLDTLLFAGPVSREKALQVADKVFRSMPETKGAAPALQIVWDGEFEQTKGNVDPAFYVVTREGGGFVIVAGNDDVQPVLGFSFENPFVVEGMPAHVRAWMEQIKAYVRSGVAPTPEVKEKWEDFVETKSALPGPFTDEYEYSRTGEWGQGAPFNYYAPTITDQQEQAVTGCVPLALAEIMAWFGAQNKDAGEGTVEGYTYTVDYGGDAQHKHTIPAHSLGTVYSWEALQNCMEASDFDTALGRNAAQLIYDIGTILQVHYNDANNPGEGTAGNLEYLNRLTTMLYYTKWARERNSWTYSSRRWLSMMIEEIGKHPVFCSGGGHAYVADGYATYAGDQVIHYNLGWFGYCNGYYYIDNLNTEAGTYTAISALFDFEPDPEEVSAGAEAELSFFYEEGDVSGLTNEGYSGPYTLIGIKNLTNTGYVDFSGDVALFIVDRNGNRGTDPLYAVMDFGSNPFPVGYGVSTNTPMYIQTPSNLSFGDRYVLFYRVDDSSEYRPVVSERKDKVMTEIAIYPTAFIQTQASYSVGDYFVFELNNNDYKYGYSSWTVTDPAGNVKTYSQDDYHVLLDKAGEYKIAVSTELPDTYEVETIVTFITVSE